MYRIWLPVLLITCSGIPGMADDSASDLLVKAEAAAGQHYSQMAVELATAAISKDPRLGNAYYLRGRERFRLGQIPGSLEDFDKFVELRPDLASRQWERGIACYYAKQFETDARQFELYQTFHDNDVENSVWRYLCMVPTVGVVKARAVMLPIKNDRRVPMMQVYELYRGNLQPDDVLAACHKGNPPPDVLAKRLFYAHLYLGLYYEVAGKKELAAKYIHLAADKRLAKNRGINRYMWDVARIHEASLQKHLDAGGGKNE